MTEEIKISREGLVTSSDGSMTHLDEEARAVLDVVGKELEKGLRVALGLGEGDTIINFSVESESHEWTTTVKMVRTWPDGRLPGLPDGIELPYDPRNR